MVSLFKTFKVKKQTLNKIKIMRIEVTKETFYTIFKKEEYKTTKNELCEVAHYKNSKLEQSGLKVWNFVSSKGHQYYLNDINL